MKKVVQKIVAAGTLLNNGKVLIVQRSEGDSFAGLWEVPSGKKEDLEQIETAVAREFKEEVGVDVTVVKPISVFNFQVEKEDEIRDATQINFLVKAVGDVEVKLSSEHQNFAWISEDEIDNYNISPETKKVLHTAFVELANL